jgi:hypothetical protein
MPRTITDGWILRREADAFPCEPSINDRLIAILPHDVAVEAAGLASSLPSTGASAVRRDEITDHRAYEEECAKRVRDAFSGRNSSRWLAETGRELRRVELADEFPNTELRVTLYDGRRSFKRERTFSYERWGPETNIHANEELQPEPSLIASNIFTWTMEE